MASEQERDRQYEHGTEHGQAREQEHGQEQDQDPENQYTMEATILPPANMDADEYDHDSTFGGDRESLASSSTSLNSEITRYQFEHGRRYHGYRAGAYLFPNDEEELNRMDIEHQNCLVQFDGKLHLCPLDNPREILDLGTGTGLWAIDMVGLSDPRREEVHAEPSTHLGRSISRMQRNWNGPESGAAAMGVSIKGSRHLCDWHAPFCM
jgi:hypothetical protein